MKKPILVSGDLDEDEGGEIIIRGTISKEAINSLQIGPYQRMANFSPAKVKRIVKAIEAGRIRKFPDIILGMRGEDWSDDDNGDFLLRNPVFLIDGQQRTVAWDRACINNPQKNWRLGVKVYLNTTQEREAEMFKEYNLGQTPVAASVMLRNEKETSRVAAMLFGVTHQASFALKDRVCWDQVPNKGSGGDLINGSTLLKILTTLHAHKFQNTASVGGARVLETLASIDGQIDTVGLQQARANLVTFFDVIDEAWGIRNIIGSYRARVYLNWGWMDALTKVFSAHTDFWRGKEEKELFVAANFIRDLQDKVDPTDDELVRLVRGSKTGREILYEYMVKHINKGKIVNRLKERKERQQREDDATDQPGA
jgi:hypothetical protein